MAENPELAALLACPRCDRALEVADDTWRCAGCRVEFPNVDGIPWIFAEPDAALSEWRGRFQFALAKLDHERGELTVALQQKELSALTRRRLERLAEAKRDHGARLRALLGALGIDAPAANHETYLALRTRLPTDQGLTTYYSNVHRDWAWGEEENAASYAIVAQRLGPKPPGKVLVLGVGAGRLAYDIHQQSDAALTVALDFNPLLLVIAERMTRGESLELYEFPLAPLDVEHQAVLRTLRAPAPARAGLHYVLADAHRPPFAKESFDTVITPWLVDILPEPFGEFAARVNTLLAADGRWINFGSLSFHSADPTRWLTREECAEIIAATGFAAPELAETTIPYMCSPASRHGRRERVLSWTAAKTRNAKKIPRHEALPDWLVRGKDPVPLLDSFRTQATATRIHAFIMSLIDGRRSVSDMAQLLEQQRLMTRDEAEPAIRSFLIKMYEDSRRGGSH